MLSVKKLESLIIEPTNSCNLRCGMCPMNGVASAAIRKKGFMPFLMFKDIIDQTPGIKRVSLNNWGESLLHPDIVKMIGYAKKKGVEKVLLCTNGTMLDAGLSRSILAAGLDTLEVSIDGLQDSYERVRGFNYQDLLARVDDFIWQRNNGYPGCELGVVMVDNGAPQEEINEFKKLWMGKAGYVKIQPCLGRKTRVKPCPELWGSTMGRLVVLWDGTVVPCCADHDGALSVGNVAEENLASIWNGPRLNQMREEHASGRFSGFCATCDDVIENKFIGAMIYRP